MLRRTGNGAPRLRTRWPGRGRGPAPPRRATAPKLPRVSPPAATRMASIGWAGSRTRSVNNQRQIPLACCGTCCMVRPGSTGAGRAEQEARGGDRACACDEAETDRVIPARPEPRRRAARHPAGRRVCRPDLARRDRAAHERQDRRRQDDPGPGLRRGHASCFPNGAFVRLSVSRTCTGCTTPRPTTARATAPSALTPEFIHPLLSGPPYQNFRVELTAVPDPGWYFVGWTGLCAGGDQTCEIPFAQPGAVSSTSAAARRAPRA